MKILIIGVSFIVFHSLVFAHRDHGIFNERQVETLAMNAIDLGVSNGMFEKSWKAHKKFVEINNIHYEQFSFWRVTITNETVQYIGKKNLYVFVSTVGQVLGFSHEAEPGKRP